jgi:ubiquinol-cytochrome c reductase iron-sulfur subunit
MEYLAIANLVSHPQDISPPAEPARRDFLIVAAGSIAGVGLALSAWPFIDQMKPGAAALAAGGPITVNLAPLQPGQRIIVKWRSRPIFIVRRTPTLLAKLCQTSLPKQLRDPDSDQLHQPPYARNWSRSIEPEFLVLIGISTHLGCVPTFTPTSDALGANCLAATCATAMARNTIWPAASFRACPRPTIFRYRPIALPVPPLWCWAKIRRAWTIPSPMSSRSDRARPSGDPARSAGWECAPSAFIRRPWQLLDAI